MGRGGATSQQAALFEDYDGFVEKFKPKRTTDDCYTPPEVMEVVNAYVADRWGLDPASFVRPFWPGGDYERFDYPDGCTVVDNPPFSINSKIWRTYLDRGIRFFLFAPTLTCLTGSGWNRCDHIVCDSRIAYENGAVVPTSFVTNLEAGVVLETDFGLSKAVTEASNRAAKGRNPAKELPKYEYPDELLTAAKAQWLARHGQRLVVRRGDCCRVSRLDAQEGTGKSIFGGGLLLSDRAAAERARAHRWPLSDREREMVRMMGGADGNRQR